MSSIVDRYLKECASKRTEPYYGFICGASSGTIDCPLDFVPTDDVRRMAFAMTTGETSTNQTAGAGGADKAAAEKSALAAAEMPLRVLKLTRGIHRDRQHPPVRSRELEPYRKLLVTYGKKATGGASIGEHYELPEMRKGVPAKLVAGVALAARSHCATLTHLHLVAIDMDAPSCKKLSAEALPFCVVLMSLDLSRNPCLGDEGAVAVGQALPRMPVIERLALAGCSLAGPGAARAITSFITSNRDKEHAGAWKGSLRSAAAANKSPSGGAAVSSGLRHLDLSDNYLGGSELVDGLLRALQHDTSLDTVLLRNNTLSQNDVRVLAEFVASSLASLRALDLSGASGVPNDADLRAAIPALAASDVCVVGGFLVRPSPGAAPPSPMDRPRQRRHSNPALDGTANTVGSPPVQPLSGPPPLQAPHPQWPMYMWTPYGPMPMPPPHAGGVSGMPPAGPHGAWGWPGFSLDGASSSFRGMPPHAGSPPPPHANTSSSDYYDHPQHAASRRFHRPTPLAAEPRSGISSLGATTLLGNSSPLGHALRPRFVTIDTTTNHLAEERSCDRGPSSVRDERPATNPVALQELLLSQCGASDGTADDAAPLAETDNAFGDTLEGDGVATPDVEEGAIRTERRGGPSVAEERRQIALLKEIMAKVELTDEHKSMEIEQLRSTLQDQQDTIQMFQSALLKHEAAQKDTRVKVASLTRSIDHVVGPKPPSTVIIKEVPRTDQEVLMSHLSSEFALLIGKGLEKLSTQVGCGGPPRPGQASTAPSGSKAVPPRLGGGGFLGANGAKKDAAGGKPEPPAFEAEVASRLAKLGW